MSRYTPPKNRDNNLVLGQYWFKQFQMLQAENDALYDAYLALLKLATSLAGDNTEVLESLKKSLLAIKNDN